MPNSKPIIFTGDMVRAILDGRKTQTRRVVKWPLLSHSDGAKQRIFCPSNAAEINMLLEQPGNHPNRRIRCPYGAPGGLLWVRESWYDRIDRPAEMHDRSSVFYAATEEPPEPCLYRKRPSIHLPKWAARIWLRVTDIRVERVQEISQEDIVREGLDPVPGDPSIGSYTEWIRLWDSINAKRGYPWADTPWVWVISFEVEEVRDG